MPETFSYPRGILPFTLQFSRKRLTTDNPQGVWNVIHFVGRKGEEENMKIRNMIIPLLLIFSLFTCTLMTGCSADQVQKSIDIADEVDSVTSTAISGLGFAVQDGLLTQAQSDVLGPKLNAFQSSVAAFKNAAVTLQSQYDGNIPPDKLTVISTAFDSKVVAPFLAVLLDLHVIKGAEKILAAVEILRIAVLKVAQALGKHQAVALINKRFQEEHIPIDTYG